MRNAVSINYQHTVLIIIIAVIVCAAHNGAHGRTIEVKSTCGGEAEDILKQLRTLMADPINAIQAYIIPMNDAHQNEYVADQDMRIQYVTKFTGSAGEAIITETEARLWTDSRYHLQAEQQLNLDCWTLMKQGLTNVSSASDWLVNNLPENSTVGVDPFLMTASAFRSTQSKLIANGHKLIGLSQNLVDAIWNTRPVPEKTSLFPVEVKYTGKESNLKISEVMDEIKKEGGESIVITALDDIAWLLNLRGSDIKYNPVFFSYALLMPNKSYFFVDKEKIDNKTKAQMNAEMADLILRDYDDILDVLVEAVNVTTGKFIVSSSVSQAISQVIPSERCIVKNVVASLKSVKNDIETKNMVKAHIRDGLALVQYLHWLNATIDKENVTEISGAEKLTEFRAKQENFRGISFQVISAVGEHAAMAHYTPSMETNRQITRDEIYLVDSGGHYWDGTTDVTRTLHFGIPSANEKLCYTRVLKGFIALATSVFPKDTPLSYFDNMARRALWQVGLNYGHGTGHGVGMYLYVHEYPPSIGAKSTDTLQKNMFTSNEPGYYRDNEFGIRIEDVIQVIESDIENAFMGDGALTFRSITCAPLQTKLIDTELLTKEEANYVNTYNKRVLDTIGPILLKHKLMDTYQWLVEETRQICSWAK